MFWWPLMIKIWVLTSRYLSKCSCSSANCTRQWSRTRASIAGRCGRRVFERSQEIFEKCRRVHKEIWRKATEWILKWILENAREKKKKIYHQQWIKSIVNLNRIQQLKQRKKGIDKKHVNIAIIFKTCFVIIAGWRRIWKKIIVKKTN